MGITDLAGLPPAMRQYVEIKAGYEDCILLFRMGDFYEIFFADAVTAAIGMMMLKGIVTADPEACALEPIPAATGPK